MVMAAFSSGVMGLALGSIKVTIALYNLTMYRLHNDSRVGEGHYHEDTPFFR